MRCPIAEWDFVGRTLEGERESGDHCFVNCSANRLLLAVVDGLGHGKEAAAAANLTVATLAEHAHEELVPLVRYCHQALRGTRGVVLSLAAINVTGQLTWLGIGNVEGLLLRAAGQSLPQGLPSGRKLPDSTREHLLLRGGVIGYELPSLYISQTAIRPGDMILFVTDGIRPNFADALSPHLSPTQIVQYIFSHYYRGTDDALALSLRYLGSDL